MFIIGKIEFLQKKDIDWSARLNSGAIVLTKFVGLMSMRLLSIKEIKNEKEKNSTY